MRGWLGAMAGAALALLAGAAAGDERRADADFSAQIEAARAAEDADPAEGERMLRALIASPEFRAAPAQQKTYAQRLLGWALLDQRKCDEALALGHRLVTAPAPGEYDWRYEIYAAVGCGQRERAAAALAALRQTYPDALADMDSDMVMLAAAASDDPQLLSYLVDGNWRPKRATIDISGLRLALVRAYVSHGDQERAAEAAQALVANGANLASILILELDKTFDAIVAASPATYDLDGILSWRMNNARTAAQANPTSLEAVNSLARAFYERNQLAEAKALVEDALGRVAATPDAPPYGDLDANLNWTRNLQSEIEKALGDNEAAVAALRSGAETLEQGSPNVSQRLNLASMLADLGEPQQALAQIENFDTRNTSSYGVMVLRNVRVCAYAQLHDETRMRAELAEMTAHAEDGPSVLVDAALCAGDDDLAATWFMRQFDEPLTRLMAILSVQNFAGDGEGLTPRQRERYDRFAAILARPDVHAAIERACHVRSFALRRPY